MTDGRNNRAAGDQLRRIVATLHRGRKVRSALLIAALAGVATVPLAASVVWTAPILLVWNASASAPVGLYRLLGGAPPRRGDMAVAWAPRPGRRLAARRHYVPANVPLVKRVAAVAGDRVCAAGGTVSINGRQATVRRRSDPAGRPMPWWHGCHRLRPHEYFLLTDSPLSFDGRYFGITRGSEILGKARLLWPR